MNVFIQALYFNDHVPNLPSQGPRLASSRQGNGKEFAGYGALG